ncbi:hypothetical protein THIOKS1860030 [Thiocapsa sp. KS1]|nr:hypothetical protein THIOKS1860030 [Thiocapsa sp. KS1]
MFLIIAEPGFTYFRTSKDQAPKHWRLSFNSLNGYGLDDMCESLNGSKNKAGFNSLNGYGLDDRFLAEGQSDTTSFNSLNGYGLDDVGRRCERGDVGVSTA